MPGISPKTRRLPPLVIGIYGAGPTGDGYSNADVKAIADATGGKMYNGPGNMPETAHWALPILNAIDARYLKSGTPDMPPPEKLILFGYSMGGRAAVAVAAMLSLQKKYNRIKVALAGIDPVELQSKPVTLTLPENVVAWVNYYQHDETGQGIIDFKWAWPPVDVDFTRISGSPLKAGPKAGPGTNYRLTSKTEGQRVDHVTLPSLPKVKKGVLAFICTHQ
jgi:hypothetical protein